MKNGNYLAQHKSIKSRLFLHYSLAIMIIFSLIALIMYWITISLFNRADYDFLADEINNTRYVLEMKSLDQGLLHEIAIDNPTKTHNSMYRYYIRIFNKSGVIIETPGISNIISVQDNRVKLYRILNRTRYYRFNNANKNFLIAQVPIKIANQIATLQVLLDTSYQHTMLHDRRTFVFVLIAGILISFLIGIMISHRGLQSLQLLTEKVKNITMNSLDQRIDSKSWPKELNILGDAFNQMLDRIETSFSRLKQMSADMSHELRTPVTNLIGQTEILLSYPHGEEEYKTAFVSNLEELQRLSSIIENILFLARADYLPIELERMDIQAEKEIANMIEYHQAMADEKNIQITLSGHAHLRVHPVMFRRLMNNLISNAVKYTKENGWIKINIHATNAKTTIISVQDNGIGIDAKHLSRLFDRFYRVDSSRSTQIRGTGLGLSIAKSIVDLHKGTIRVQSEMGAGSCFEVYI